MFILTVKLHDPVCKIHSRSG